jgi:phosphopantetheinyl transferase
VNIPSAAREDLVTGAVRVHLYYAERRSLTVDIVDALVTFEDRQRLTPTMVPRRRGEYLAGRALLRHALAQHTGREPASLQIRVSATGKPQCIDGPEISVSHSGEALICALADVAVGVDVETAAPRDIDGIAQRYFTPAEARWLAADPAKRFRMLWVLKEAYLKALGVGLAGGLDALECRITPPLVVARTAIGAAPPHLALLGAQGCFVGIAILGARAPLEVALHRFAGDESTATFRSLESIATTELPGCGARHLRNPAAKTLRGCSDAETAFVERADREMSRAAPNPKRN